MADGMTCSREESTKGGFERSISRYPGVARATEKILFRKLHVWKPQKSFFRQNNRLDSGVVA
jgi:hypothetical protein